MTDTPPLVLLHGWGFSSRIWQPLMTSLAAHGIERIHALDLPGFGSSFHETATTLDDLLAWIEAQLPPQCILCGWSLGGMLATQLARRSPLRVAGLITLGSNLHFIEDGEWPGMPADDYAGFCTRFAAQPQKTWQRFLALQTRGETTNTAGSAAIEQLATFDDIEPLTADRLLRMLGEIDNRADLAQIRCKTLHLLGEQDAITPQAIAGHLRKTGQQNVVILEGASHAMPVLHADCIAAHIADFFAKLLPTDVTENVPQASADAANAIARQRIAHSFSRAADSYTRAARLQRDVSTALAATLPDDIAGTLVDLGCGTGFVTGALLQKMHRTADSQVIALDIASGMLQKLHSDFPAACPVQADMNTLPLADHSADWLLSSLALQWASDLPGTLREWRRTLKPGGQLRFSTLLPGTLRELQQSWQQVDDAVHVNRFANLDAITGALQAAGFAHIETVQATHTLYYDALATLARDLKAIGAHNMNHGQPRGLTGRQRWAQLVAAYEHFRTARGLPASYEVLYVQAH